MDRNIVWPGQVPLETDLLNTNRNVMVALGRFAMDILGSSTLASGLACTPTAPASMKVNIGAGALYSLQNIDNTAYSTLAANTADQVMKQGILLASDALQLAFTAPASAGNSIIYLVQAAYSEVDTDLTLLPYYNAANPSVPYSGPSGSGNQSATTRAGNININAKAGIAAPSPTAPAPDTGFVPLYYVTVAYGQTTITGGNISVATGAPFISGTLSSLMPISGGAFTGPIVGPTPALGDNSTKLATTAFVNNAFAASVGANGYQKLPSGLIFQWGVQTGSFPQGIYGPYSFPTAFPNACLNLSFTTISPESAGGAAGDNFIQVPSTNSPTATQFWAWSDLISSGINLANGFYWFAVGY
jgi:hypothetical protein